MDEPLLALREVLGYECGLQDEPLLAHSDVLEYGCGSHSEPLSPGKRFLNLKMAHWMNHFFKCGCP